ncbi:HAD-IIA family hydrolase [Arsenicicoccus dermatophilus]|uniref:HAD-IIA family hydrolase n=1 Tax=Arsenicicoccus dermatophilus TaxID=1076331 RepID=UPI001F4CEEF6|nr:HAD-IIA family hydrolase [Arsenicicoccus dermatophilus]MCH8613182.1 HAD-IIA family hydrolase [Arsenicicoccus dermatophilus]
MSGSSLLDTCAGLVVDLDGVVYRGAGPVQHAVDALNLAAERGLPVMYATNNASRPAAEVASHLTELGVRTDAEHVVTSAQAGAVLLAEQLAPGGVVLAVGGPGVALALREVGLSPVTPQQRIDDPAVAEQVEAVLQGYGTELTWTDLKETAYAVNAGAAWMATNVDLTIPTDRGIAPGNGSAVAAVRNAVGEEPQVAGKPYPPLYTRCADRVGGDVTTMLAVGDRLDTDIEGANRTGMPSLHVLTGVDGPVALAEADRLLRPTYLGLDLRALQEPYVAPSVDGTESATCGEATARLDGDTLEVSGGSPIEQVRAAVTLVWVATDAQRLEVPLPDGVRATLQRIDPR